MIEGTEQHQRWLQARVGKCTASRIRDVVATLKSGGYGASRAKYRAELVAERLTGAPYPQYVNASMKWGNDTEPQARAAYALFTGLDVLPPEEVNEDAFVPHPRLWLAGASPDGFVKHGGLVEFKCPDTSTHIATLRGAAIDAEYLDQMQFQMACTELKWCDWCSFDPRLSVGKQLFVRRIMRDDKRIAELEREAELFLAEVEAEVAAIEKMDKRYLIYDRQEQAA
jgi:hypothetical protein